MGNGATKKLLVLQTACVVFAGDIIASSFDVHRVGFLCIAGKHMVVVG